MSQNVYDTVNVSHLNKITKSEIKTIQNESQKVAVPKIICSKSYIQESSSIRPTKYRIINNNNKISKSSIPRHKSILNSKKNQINIPINNNDQTSGDYNNKFNVCPNLNELLLMVRENESSIQCLKSQLYAKESLLCRKDQEIQELLDKSQTINEKVSLSKVEKNLNNVKNEYKQQQQMMKIRCDLITSMQNREKLASNQIKLLKRKIMKKDALLKHFEVALNSKNEQMTFLLKSLNNADFQQKLRTNNEETIDRLQNENDQLKQQFREIISFSKL